MNLMGYDFMTFGNHEFDSGSTPEGHKVLADFIKGASFPFVSSNIDFSTDSSLSGLFNEEISEIQKMVRSIMESSKKWMARRLEFSD